MNIGIDALAFKKGDLKRGIGRYSYSLLEHLLKIDKVNQYYFFNVLKKELDAKKIFDAKNFHVVDAYLGDEGFIHLHNKLYGAAVSKFIEKYKIDIYFIPSPFNGLINIYEKNWFLNARVCSILYDAIPYIFRKEYFATKNDYITYMNTIRSVREFDDFFAISNTTKNDFCQLLKFDSNKIHVINGAPPLYIKRKKIKTTKASLIKKKYNIEEKFVIFVSGDDHRKNNVNVVKSFLNIPKELLKNIQLVIVCDMTKSTETKINNLNKGCPLKNRVIVTNLISNNDLVSLYNIAYAAVFPSKYEGLGLPVIEAFKCDLPVMTSRNSSLGEISENAAILVNPFSNKSIKKGFIKLINLNENERNELIENGRKKLSFYNWETVAKNFYSLIINIQAKKQTLNKIAFFTPLPPVKSGISDFSNDLIRVLSNYLKIDVYIDDGYDPTTNFNKNVKIFNHSCFLENYKTNLYNQVIYQVGNSIYHIYMFKYIFNIPGIIECHDGNYFDLFNCMRANFKKEYLYLIKMFFNKSNRKNIIKKVSNYMLNNRYTDDLLLRFLLHSNNNVIVHNSFCKEKCLSFNMRKINVIPLFAANESKQVDKNAARNILKIDKNEIMFVSMGSIHKTKLSLVELSAFSNFVQSMPNIKIKYYFVGRLDEAIKNEFNNFIKKHHLEKKVVVTGYIDLKLFDTYLAASDLHFNLRYPYNGESSGALARALSLGIPTVVSDIGVFSETPSDSVYKIPYQEPSNDAINSVCNIMSNFISHRWKFEKIRLNAKNYVNKNLNINTIVHKYIELFQAKRIVSLDSEYIKKAANLLNEEEINEFINTICWIYKR